MQGALPGRDRPLFWLAVSCLAVAWLIVLSEAVVGMPVSAPLVLVLTSGAMGLASTVAKPTRPRLSEFLIAGAGVISIVAIIGVLMARP